MFQTFEMRMTCEHIIDYAHEYITFFSNTDTNESFEEDIIWIDFRTEVEELKCNGKWTNCAADLLPLALSNWSRKTIKIFSSLIQKPVFDITLSLINTVQSSLLTCHQKLTQFHLIMMVA